MKNIIGIICSLICVVACGGSDDITISGATSQECPSGGTVLVDEGHRYPICDGDGSGPQGIPGRNGTNGAQGDRGPVGSQGVPGLAGSRGPAGTSDIVKDEMLCSRLITVNGVANAGLLSCYLWIMADNDAVGICSFSAGNDFSETSPIVGGSSILNGGPYTTSLITVDFSNTPPTISGGIVGTLSCI